MNRIVHLLLAASCFALPPARGEVAYTVRDLGTLGGANSRAYAVNEQGWVVGEAETREGHLRAFLWTPESGMQDLGACGGEISRAYAINERGHVAGEAEDAEGRMRPFRWNAETGLEELPLPAGFREGFVYGMNNFGMLVGGGESRAGARALVWTVDGVSVPPALQERGASVAHAVNELGVIAGQLENHPDDDYVSRAFILQWPGALDILNLGANAEWSSAALGINERGEASGFAESVAATHAIRFQRAAPAESLDTLANVYSVAHDINDKGEAVGLFVSSHEDDDRAFVWRDGVMADLNEVLESDAAWLLVEARGINNRGEIAGYGVLNNRERAVLLTPAPTASARRPDVRLVRPGPLTSVREGEDIEIEAVADPAAGEPIRRVLFFSSGVVLGSATSAPYRLTWRTPPPGTHHLVAVAMNNAGRARRSARVPVEVRLVQGTGPAVAVLEPDDGTAWLAGESMRIAAEAAAHDPAHLTIRLLLDGEEMAEGKGNLLGAEWTPVQTGLYNWVAIVHDADGRTATSTPVRVHVTAPDAL
ncbi:MAG TPA: Ig-like domain-containing protein [Kiritimatiellia bacterium]|nr:Ig-like domain-containing protein [Kiritimatiellia bacterium]